MKKMLFVLLTLSISLAVVSPAFAKKAKVPKKMCWSYETVSGTKTIMLRTKKVSNIRANDGKIDFYEIRGAFNHYSSSMYAPVSGTGFFRSNPRDVSTDPQFRMDLMSKDVFLYMNYRPLPGSLHMSGRHLDLGFLNTVDLVKVNCRDINFYPVP